MSYPAAMADDKESSVLAPRATGPTTWVERRQPEAGPVLPLPLVLSALVGAIIFVFCEPAGAEQAVDGAARIVARALAEAVIARDAEAATVLCVVPINLDGDVISTTEGLRQRWRRVLAVDALRGIQLEGIEVLTYREIVARHGPPPERLGAIDENAVVAILRWNRAILVAVLARRDDRWAIIAVTD